MFSYHDEASQKNIVAAATSLVASAILLRTIVNDVFPDQFRRYFQSFFYRFSSRITVVIDDFNGLAPNHLFEAVNAYLGARISPSARRFKVEKTEKDSVLSFSMDANQQIVDFFADAEFQWIMKIQESWSGSNIRSAGDAVMRFEHRSFELSFHRKYKEMVVSNYLPYVLLKSREIRENKKAVKLHTIDYSGPEYWSSIDFDHPATFFTMAMDPVAKSTLMDDLQMFKSRREYYRRTGRAWKRGYLLYGPPGTGKSSLVAAMANYLRYSIYDLDLREVQCNSDLRRLMIGTESRSILVIEDIDCCSVNLNRDSQTNVEDDEKISLSAVLNFIDGLWSSCGEERIIVFTTNHRERLDPALLRPGRMDVEIEMSYCRFSAFKVLANNYLGVQNHQRFNEIEELLEGGAQATPASISGELMRNKDADVALESLVEYLKNIKSGNSYLKFQSGNDEV